MFPIFAGNSASTGYNLTRSLRFRASATPWLNRTLSAGNQKTWTWSGWVKRGTLTSAQAIFDTGVLSTSDSTFARFGFDSSDAFNFTAYTVSWRTTTQVFRDPSAWYHIVLTFDTTQATAANRVKIYINGVQITAFSTSADPTLNTNYAINQAAAHYFGYPAYSYGYFDGYLAEVNFIDGQALTPSSFGSTNALTGVWQPARYTGTYGTNGFYLPFTDNSALTTSSNVGLGKDFSGNGNYWTTNNISITAGVTYDSMTDVPTLTSATAANFAVLNPLNVSSGTNFGFSNGNLTAKNSALSSGTIYYSSLIPYAGNYYFEATATTVTLNFFGVLVWATNLATYAGYYSNATSNGVLAFGASYTSGDVIGVSFNTSTGVVTFYKNNVSQGTQTITGLGGLVGLYITQLNDTWNVNFGQRPFTYTPPTGFVALCTYNLPTSTIVKGNTVMDATLYTGTLLSNAITNAASFKPDLVWIKSRSAATNHKLTDSVRGVTKSLISNTTGAETTDVQGLTAFNTNGFTVGTDTTYNNLAATYVAWQWQAGQGSTSSNTNGTITSTVSVNASAGFSVVTYTGTNTGTPSPMPTVGHGLGVAPSLIISKSRNLAGVDSGAWFVWTSAQATDNYLRLNTTAASASISGGGGGTMVAPTSSVFSTPYVSGSNILANNYVAYCWTPIAGFSAFGSYTGNGSADGPFVYTGFLPRWVLVKRTDTAGFPWWLLDTARNTYNVADIGLLANSSDSESSAGFPFSTLDFLSNGFKLRATAGGVNASGGTYIYAAFASNPFRNSLAQ